MTDSVGGVRLQHRHQPRDQRHQSGEFSGQISESVKPRAPWTLLRFIDGPYDARCGVIREEPGAVRILVVHVNRERPEDSTPEYGQRCVPSKQQFA